MSWIIDWGIKNIVECFAGVFTLIQAMSSDVFSNPVVSALMTLLKGLGAPITAVFMLLLILKSALDFADEKDFKVLDIGKRFIMSTIFYFFGVDIMKNFYLMFLNIGSTIISALTQTDAPTEFDIFATIGFNALLTLILLLISLFYMFKTFLNLIERTWHLIITLCLIYLYLPGYILGNDEGMLQWFKQCLAITFTQLFQVLLVVLGLLLFASSADIGGFIIAIGAIIGSSKVEQLLDKFGMSAGGKLGNAARNAMSVAFYAKNLLR